MTLPELTCALSGQTREAVIHIAMTDLMARRLTSENTISWRDPEENTEHAIPGWNIGRERPLRGVRRSLWLKAAYRGTGDLRTGGVRVDGEDAVQADDAQDAGGVSGYGGQSYVAALLDGEVSGCQQRGDAAGVAESRPPRSRTNCCPAARVRRVDGLAQFGRCRRGRGRR